MPRFLQSLSIWAFTAYFAGCSLLGPGWHCVFGHHFHGAACGHAHACAAAPLHAPHAASQQDARENPPGEDAGGQRCNQLQAAAAEHDCPLCKFFGTAQWAAFWDRIEAAISRVEEPYALRLSPRLTHGGFYLSRAPPACPSLY